MADNWEHIGFDIHAYVPARRVDVHADLATSRVRMTLEDSYGDVFCHRMDPEEAEKLAGLLQEAAQWAREGRPFLDKGAGI